MKQILLSGVFGSLVMFVGLLIGSSMVQFGGNTALQTVPDQSELLTELKERINEPGTYVVPYETDGVMATDPDYLDEPFFEISYKGYTHRSVPGLSSSGTLAFFFAPMIAAWLLSMASPEVLSNYTKRVLFVMALGLLVVVSDDWLGSMKESIPPRQMLASAIGSMITWILVGMVVAWQVKPRSAKGS